MCKGGSLYIGEIAKLSVLNLTNLYLWVVGSIVKNIIKVSYQDIRKYQYCIVL